MPVLLSSRSSNSLFGVKCLQYQTLGPDSKLQISIEKLFLLAVCW